MGTNWDDIALVAQYYHGVKDGVKDEISRGERPDKLHAMMLMAVQINNRLYKRQRKKGHAPYRDEKKMYSHRHKHKHRKHCKHDKYGPKEMEIDVIAPTKKKAFDGKCYNCGKKGHLARDCRGPIKNQKSGQFQASKKTKHAEISWIGCYDDSCNIHRSDKDGAGWYPQQPHQTAVVGKDKSDRYGTPPTEEDFAEAKNQYSPMYPDGPDEQTEAERWIQDAEEQLCRKLLVFQTSSELAREDVMDAQ
ncbi:Zinc finger, CCHC-type [Lasallia pustulata]|uniref:Zinc finger, CCHC-type n=1 Tax=Lasallia pustulata TaxID=136370 RepID=A0A1W5CRX6_9LECA|nr:Zinc finger, CCHC-type [Lasallia pustulata]